MAITIQQFPIGGQVITMAHNPIEFVVSSTNTAQPNFKYICDLTWTGQTTPVRYIQGADPTNGRCRFDFSSVLRNAVTFNPPTSGTTTNDFINCPDSYKTFYVAFGEQYGPTSGITTYTNLATDGMYIWNACLPIDRWWNANDPVIKYVTGGSNQKFLTDIPTRTQDNPIKVCYFDFYYLYFLQDNSTDDVKFVRINTLDSNGTILHSLFWDTAYNATHNVQRFGCGPFNLQNAGTELGFAATGSPPYFTTNVDKYSVQLFDDKGNPLTEDIWFQVECECSWETPYRLCFLNNLGGYDFFNFGWNSKKTSSYQKSFYERKTWNWNNGQYQYNSYNRGKVQYSTIGTDQLQLTSGWITEEQSTWLEELISSPDVYIIDSAGTLIAVTVKDTQYDYKTLEYDQLFNLTVTLEFAFNRYRQAL